MNVKAWCRENGISTGSYYFHLRKIRESVLEEHQLVTVQNPKPKTVNEFRIESGGITITLTENATPEQLTAVLFALKSC